MFAAVVAPLLAALPTRLKVPSLSIIVIITQIGVRTGAMNPDVSAALVGAALLSGKTANIEPKPDAAS